MRKHMSLALAFAALCASAEAQDFSAWDVASANPDLSVTTAAAYGTTTYGMQAVVDDGDILLVRDNTPSAEPRYRARFYFNTNDYTLGDNIRLKIFMAQRDSDNARLITLQFRRIAGVVSFLIRVPEDSGVIRSLPLGQYPGPEGFHQIEFDWQRATAPGANNGRMQVWVDGVERANVTNLDNDLLGGIDFARMGVMNPVVGSGTLFFDEFESRRQTFIGPIAP